jgi:hypothetical protein
MLEQCILSRTQFFDLDQTKPQFAVDRLRLADLSADLESFTFLED